MTRPFMIPLFKNIAWLFVAIVLTFSSAISLVAVFLRNVLHLMMGTTSYWELDNEWYQITQDFYHLNLWRKR